MAPGRRKGETAERGTRAAESGARIQHGRQGLRERQADRAESARQFDESVEQRNLDRYQRQWEQRRKDREQRDADRAANQAGKPRTTNFGQEGYLAGQERRPSGDARLDENARQFDERQAQQERQFQQSQAQQQGQFDTRTDLTAATQGLQRGPSGIEGGNPGPDNPRLQALQQEMSQRQQQQMGAGVEQRGRRGFVPTEDAQEDRAREAGLAERDMRTKEINAAANFQRAVTSYERLGAEATAAKTSAAKKEIQAKQKAVEESLAQPIKSDSARLDRFMKGDQTTSDMQTLQAMIKNVPPVGNARALHDEVASGEVGPNVTRFLGEKVAASAIQFIYATGKLPDGKLVDFSSAGMQEFSRRAMEARQLLMPNTVAGQMLNAEQVTKIKRGYTEHLEMVNKLAALLVLKQQPAGLSGALTGQQEPTHEQRRADPSQPITPAERAGQITPEEAGRRAEAGGGRAAPETGKKPYKRPPPSPPMGTRGGLSGNLPYGV